MLNKLKSVFKHPSVRNSFWIIGERVVQMLISFIITMISARYLGPSNYGILNYGASFVTFFLAITKLGLDSVIVNELINNKEKEGQILGTSLIFRLISSLISIFLISLCVIILNPNQKLVLITTVLQSIVLIFQALSFLDYWFQTKLQSKYVSIAKSVAYIVASIYKVYLLVQHFSVEWFALSSVIDYFIICLFLFIFYKYKKGPKLSFNFKLGASLISKSYHFIISGIMVVIYTQIDKIMIGNMIDEASVGIYAAALTIHSAFGFIPEAIIISSRPTIYNAKNKNNELYIRRLKQTFCVIFWICCLFALGTSLFASQIIGILYGDKYISAVLPLIILVWSIPFSQLGNARGIWIVSEGLNKYTKKYLTWGAIINVILNYILILKIGILGAAIATLITEFFVCIVSPLIYRDTRCFSKLAIESVIFKFGGDNNAK